MTKRIIKEVSTTGKIPRKEIEAVVSAVHVARTNNGWQVKKSGKHRIAEIFSSKKDAVEFAHGISQTKGVDVIVHKTLIDGCESATNGNSKSAE